MAMVWRERRRVSYSEKSRLITADRIIVSDIDNTLIGDREGLTEFLRRLHEAGERVAFGVATGRSMKLALEVLKKWKIPTPQLLVTSVGTAIHYGRHLVEDMGWQRHISYRWRPNALREAVCELPGLKLQPPHGQDKFKVSFDVDPDKAPSPKDVLRHLRRSRLQANVIYSHRAYLDLLPIRASKGMALRYFGLKWGLPPERCLVAGDSGNDEEMLTGNTLGIVVGNHDRELEHLRGDPRIYFSDGHYAWGIIEGIEHYDFFGAIRTLEAEGGVHD
jgi:sucrose-phosphate synthase